MNNKIILLTTLLLSFLLSTAVCIADQQKESLTLAELMSGIADYEKKEVSLVATIAGACNSGCKIWVSDGVYKKGDPVALVWAKDKAFTFSTEATGQKASLKGYAVGKYIDLCAIEKGEKSGEENVASDCNPIVETETGQKQLRSITFFATSVEYL